MKLTRWLFILSVGVAVIALAVGYGISGLWGGAPIFLLVGFFWWYSVRRNLGGAIFFVVLLLAAAIGILIGVGVTWSVLCLVAALTAWDLEGLIKRLKEASRVDMASRIETAHLRWLLLVNGTGLLLAAIVPMIRVRFPFGVALLAVLLVFVGLSRGIGYLKLKS